jgi:hypothetical protein
MWDGDICIPIGQVEGRLRDDMYGVASYLHIVCNKYVIGRVSLLKL